MSPAAPVLIIDPSEPSRRRAAQHLESLGFNVRQASDAFDAHPLLDGSLSVIATYPSAANIFPRLRSAGIPLIVSFTSRQAGVAETAAELGADAFVLRPYRRDLLSLALFSAHGSRLLRERAVRAELALAEVTAGRRGDRSGLLDAELFKTLLPLEIRRARRHKYPIAICVVALDPLPVGDRMRIEVARAAEPFLRSAVRDVDLAARYGDDRFLVFLPHTDGAGATTVAARIVAELRNCRLKRDGVQIMVTASVGIAAPRAGHAPSFARLVRDAHAAVKAAQLKGGDRAILR